MKVVLLEFIGVVIVWMLFLNVIFWILVVEFNKINSEKIEV